MSQVGIITPVTDGRAHDLRSFLSALPQDQPPTADGRPTTPSSPFTGVLPPTHFARFVVIELDDDRPYLLFTSVFDGGAHDYLHALAATPTAQEIWSYCQIADAGRPLTETALKRYLCDEGNWRPSQYVVSAVAEEVTVGQINRALSLRAQLGSLVRRAAAVDATALAHDFRQLAAVQALMTRR
jgi:hypothetical protein